MNRNDLRQQLERYVPVNEQEEKDLKQILSALAIDNIFSRENEIMHMTASAWVVNRSFTKVLMAYHRIYESWAWLGGHADGAEGFGDRPDPEGEGGVIHRRTLR